MPIRKYKPTTPGRRQMTVLVFDEITTDKPHGPLTENLHTTGGRNSSGEQTIWWRGGGHKRLYRIIDFKRDKAGIPARVATIEYDPNRSARIALLVYADGEKRYIIAPDKLTVGQTVVSGPDAPPDLGNGLPLSNIPLGTQVHAIEMKPGKGAQLARSAGTYATPFLTALRMLQCRMLAPATRISPESYSAAPNTARHTSSRPDPSVPTIATHCPGCTDRETSRYAPLRVKSLISRTGAISLRTREEITRVCYGVSRGWRV